MVMEPVRGGKLATLPLEAEKMLRAAHPDWSMGWEIKGDLTAITTEGRLADCIQCGACMGHCPQSIQIPDLMPQIAEMEAKF